MPTVDLVYDVECPNVTKARANLLRAFTRAGMKASWSEYRRADPASPTRVRGYGSPTVLVDGRDVAGVEPGAGACCRIYFGSGGGSGAPSIEQIAEALSRSVKRTGPRTASNGISRSSIAVLPGLGFALLPKVACPACWPAYASVLGSLGLGFLMDEKLLLPLTALFLLLAVGGLAFHARRRRGFGPFFIGLAAAGLALAGKFAFESTAGMYAGLGVLAAASIWNSWPRRAAPACPACTTS